MRKFLVVATLALLASCAADGLVKDQKTRERIDAALEKKYEMFGKDAKIFSLLKDQTLPAKEREALEFLYAYAPISDMNVDHDLIKDHVKVTLQAKEEMPWGATIPEDIFLHYVLPIRTNNEPLDSARVIFYRELKDRVKGLSIQDAALEVNHWCHEKMVYGSTDARTFSPLQSLKTAMGRCGEESVFAIAAMRAAGIPARQVYTPRWAHSDDNHAWVEVWSPEGWNYLGACEPEALLNMGWFTIPATRSLLTHSKVFGDYHGSDEVVSRAPSFTEINSTANYTDTKKVYIKAVDESQKAVEGAKVEFRIYNYAELYPAATMVSDSQGLCSITLGLGELIVWASKEGKLGIEKLSVPNTDTLVVALSRDPSQVIDLEFDLIPPIGSKVAPVVASQQQQDENSRRLKEEDDLRNSYVASFPTSEANSALAEELSLDKEWLDGKIKNSRGNHATIISFLKSTNKELLSDAKLLLDAISTKDLMDIELESLVDHLENSTKFKGSYDENIWASYILNPRVSREAITPYKSKFSPLVDGKSPEQIIEIAASIKIVDEYNYTSAMVKPTDVAELTVADSNSRSAYFVALSRSAGTPARIEESTGKVQYYSKGEWMDVDFGGTPAVAPDRGSIKVNCISPESVTDPKYSTHFTFAKMDGTLPKTISMRHNKDVDMGGGASAGQLFGKPISLDAGRYIAVSGTRNSSGEVAAKVQSFAIEKDQQTNFDLTLRESIEVIETLATLESNVKVSPTDKAGETIEVGGDRHILLALIEPKAEPTNHSLRALKTLTDQLTSWSGEVVVALESQEIWERYNANEFGKLPIDQYVVDSKGEIAHLASNLGLKEGNLPYYIIISSNGEVLFTSEGYQINLGDNISKVIGHIK